MAKTSSEVSGQTVGFIWKRNLDKRELGHRLPSREGAEMGLFP